MWENFENRIEENERQRPVKLRWEFFEVLRSSGLRPGARVTKKMASFEFGASERLLWEITTPNNVYLHAKWRDLVTENGFASDMRPYKRGMNNGGRHTALSCSWSFGDADCFVMRIENTERLRQLVKTILGPVDALVYKSEAAQQYSPSAGVVPSFGTRQSEYVDGLCSLYMAVFKGDVTSLLGKGKSLDDGQILVKVGMSNEPERRCSELNSGFPPSARGRWEMDWQSEFPDGQSAFNAESALTGC